MKTIIAGSRSITDLQLIEHAVERSGFVISEVVCGGAKGVDSLGKIFASQKQLPVRMFFPDWIGLGKVAGIVRNEEMAKYAEALIAVWDGISPGTKNMIQYAYLDEQYHFRFTIYKSTSQMGD